MARIARRGKGPGDQSQRVEPAPVLPSKLLLAVLKMLDLSFERDIGMLDGISVRTIPDKRTLMELQGQLDKLNSTLDTITNNDQETIDTLRRIRDTQEVKNEAITHNDVVPDSIMGSIVKDYSMEPTPTVINNLNELEVSPEETSVVEDKETPDNKPDTIEASSSGDAGADINTNLDIDANMDMEVDDKNNDEELTKKHSPDIDNDTNELKRQRIETDKESESSDNILLDKDQPANVDLFEMENDPSVKNPKSEFVVSQTLPAAASALGLFSEEGLESTGEDYFKKIYSVASYPINDLKELLPGELPDMDFSCPKPTNQIQFSTFLSSVDNFFKDFADEDIKLLKANHIIPTNLQVEKAYDTDVTPYVIPKLGPLYSNVWLKEDDQNLGGTSPPSISDPSMILPRKSGSDINDAALETEEISCGPLVSRLLSAILKGDNDTLPEDDLLGNGGIKSESSQNNLLDASYNKEDDDKPSNDVSTAAVEIFTNPELDEINKTIARVPEGIIPNQQDWKINSINLDYPTFEERLKRELKYVGIYMNMPKDENSSTGDDPDWLTGREDDEISAELRELQSSLKSVTGKNQKRKSVIITQLERYLAWQEYMSILDDLDKQIDQAYIKRVRVPKKKKKHHTANAAISASTSSQVAQQKAANFSLKALLDKRHRWISKIGPLFDTPETMKRIPKESIFRDIDQEEDDEEADVFGQNNNTKDDDLTEV